MWLYFTLVSLLAAQAVAKDACSPIKVGCFKHDGKLDHILYSDNEHHKGEDFHTKSKINFQHFHAYLDKALCRCETIAAQKGYAYYSLRNFGECHGIKKIASEERQSSRYCLDHNYQECASRHQKCFGADDGEYIYEVTMQLTHEITNPKELITDVFCEHRGQRTIECSRDHVIDIESAFYGRLSKDHCGYHEHYNLNCRATTSGQRIRNACNGVNKCTLFPDDSVYGNPCGVTWKYIQVQYSCIHKARQPKLKQAVFCEGAGERNIQCPAGQVLDIQSGFYGRMSKDYCTYNEGESLDCVAETSEQRIETKCSGKSICYLNPHNDVYGNPCEGTRKYIQVKYNCVMAYTLARLTQAVFCEHKGAQTIKCPGNTVIDVKSGYYGRLDKYFCGYKDSYHTECVSSVSQHKVKVACNGENQCTLNPSSDVYGNPCDSTEKYLQVNYSCESKPEKK